ncbi:DUF1285 domain-containing protein [Aliidiomarina minuta]|uniref:DUF1285 domain-containing protein n=1 Tax=Aliidiomarina minuta TaxID=880057 RepID=A0A432W4S1_9GAMM|nr:DUF1285 domain-containing protein [Aliidiomarina minuta]RUO24501.1 DUF1285 domain-containing protein [Aliidiomarina minuta]
MIDLKDLTHSLQQQYRAPVEKWDPPFCGDIDIRITADGEWLYQGSPIKRVELVRLFASVLWRENDEYYLITPAEKVRIVVEDCPFIVTEWHNPEDKPDLIQLVTNIGEVYILSHEHPLRIVDSLPAVEIRDGFLARVHRNVYYQWAALAEEARDDEKAGYYLQSGDARFWLGPQS